MLQAGSAWFHSMACQLLCTCSLRNSLFLSKVLHTCSQIRVAHTPSAPPCSSVNISGRVEQHAAAGKVLLVAVDSVYPMVQDAGSLSTAAASACWHGPQRPCASVESCQSPFFQKERFHHHSILVQNKDAMRCLILNRLQTQQRGLVPATAFTAAILTPSRVADER
jgi:hypothetical protein